MSKLRRKLSILFTASIFTMLQTASAEVLWDNWYIENTEGKPTAYYNEKAEIVGDRAKIKVNEWEKQLKGVSTRNLGASAKNTPLLEPLLYNFRTQDRGVEKSIDGTILNNGKVFSVKIKTGDLPIKSLRAEMIPKLILASFFPLWINKNYKRINGVQPIEFSSIVEDQIEDQVPIAKGTAYEMRMDDFATAHQARKLRIEFNKIVAIWWVSKKGDAIKIEIPSYHKIVIKINLAIWLIFTPGLPGDFFCGNDICSEMERPNSG